MVKRSHGDAGSSRGEAATTAMPSNEQLLDGLGRLVDEEMHLLAQELEDSLNSGESGRLADISAVLDEAQALLVRHRRTRPGG
ncbi:MAG: hypothetical protein ACR2QO_03725 [Acidimicrobiales bacterium]